MTAIADSVAAHGESSKTASQPGRPRRPDHKEFQARIEEVNKEINAIKSEMEKFAQQLNELRAVDKNDAEKQELNSQIEAVRAEQSVYNEKREYVQSQLKHAQDVLKRKIDEVKMTREKLPFRSTGDIDKKLLEIDSRVSSGRLSLVEEKRMLSDASALRKQRKAIEALGPQEMLIETEKKKVDDLRGSIDSLEPEHKRFKKQLDELFGKLREMQAGRTESSKKFKTIRAERDKLSKKVGDLIAKRQLMYDEHKKLTSEYDVWFKEDKAKKDAIYKAEREERAKQRKLEAVQRALEKAELPAYESEISTCNALMSMLNNIIAPAGGAPSKAGTTPTKTSSAAAREDAVLPKGVSGSVMLKKKSDVGEEFYFKPTLGKHAAKKQTSEKAPKADKDLKFDLAVLDQFLKLKIQTPSKAADIVKTVGELEEKKKFFLQNQERATKENMAKAKKLEEKVLKSIADGQEIDVEAIETGNEDAVVVVADSETAGQ